MGVGMRHFIDEDQTRVMRQCRIQVKFVHCGPMIRNGTTWQHGEPSYEGFGLSAPMRLYPTHGDIHALCTLLMGRCEHSVSLPHPNGGSQENIDLTPRLV